MDNYNENINVEEDTIDLGNLFYQIWQNKTVVILVTLVFAVAGFFISSFVIKPKYEASADMMVNNRNTQNNSQDGVSQADIQASSQLVDTYSVILKSHNVLEKVISDCKLNYSYEELNNMITVDAVDTTQVMRITVQDGDPKEALKIVTDIVKLAPDAIMNSIDAGSVTTTDQPWTTGKPVSPKVSRNTLIAGVIGFVLACLAYVIRDLTNDKFKTVEDVRNVLNLNVLGVIPNEDSSAIKKNAKRRKKNSGGKKHAGKGAER